MGSFPLISKFVKACTIVSENEKKRPGFAKYLNCFRMWYSGVFVKPPTNHNSHCERHRLHESQEQVVE